MFQFPNPKTDEPRQSKIQRRLEMIPGILTWGTLLGMPLLSFLVPTWVAVFIIVFDIYWIYRTIFISAYSIMAYKSLKKGSKINWWDRCCNLSRINDYLKDLQKELEKNESQISVFTIAGRLAKKEKIRISSLINEMETLKKNETQIINWKKIIHVVLLPTAGEPAEVIEPAIQSVADNHFPNDQIIILLATEEREEENHRKEKVEYLKNKFQNQFRDFLVTTHIVEAGEMKCKASNATFAAKKLIKYLDERKIDYKDVIFSNFDCDSVCHPHYFAALTYTYATDPKRLQRSYQPIPMYHNNLWDTNAFVRVIVTSSSFWHMYQSTRREMVTFSSHSEPFDTLVKVNFWPLNMISEDSIIYWKCFTYYHGDYRVTPIYLPISLDAVLAPTYWRTIKNQYKQKRRWAYGVENFPVIMRAIWPDRKISIFRKLKIVFEMLEGHHSWATAPLIIAFLGWLPLILGGTKFNESVLAHNLPFITRYLMTLAMFGLIISVFMSMLLLPPRPDNHSKRRYIYMLLQWFLVPIIAPTLGAMPAIDSQTRILIKKYFGEFWVTEKMKK
jgi:hypothetical protein